MVKRMISLALCIVMIFTMIPAQAMSLETDMDAAENLVGETSETIETTDLTDPAEEPEALEETEPTCEPSVPTETEPESEEEEEAEVVLFQTETMDVDCEDLLLGYLSPMHTGGEMSVFGTLAGERLSPANKLVYNAVRDRILQITGGEENNAKVVIDFSGSGLNGEDVDILLILDALLFDFPYDLYWCAGCYYLLTPDTVLFVFKPNTVYWPDNFDANTSPFLDSTKFQKAAEAAENIFAIKNHYASYSDYDKLAAYADEICALVEYDHYAADNDTYELNCNPWTLINVFDGDPTTNVVCEGYAEAFQYLCEESTFDGVVACYSVTGNEHKWNIVRIEGISYLMDVTHCDNSLSGLVAVRGPKFLGGGVGSIATGYSIGGFDYVYYDSTKAIYGTGDDSILKLSETKYVPSAIFTIQYDANGGSGAPDSQKKTQGVGMTLRDEIPVWSGHIFQGWATTSTATAAEYQPGDLYSADSDLILYAVWLQSGCSHSFGSFSTVKEPTCETAGVEERTCGLCGETESQQLPAKGHEKKILDKVPATCTSDGLTEGSYCASCGEIFVKQEVIPAGHTIVNNICTGCNAYGSCGNNLIWNYDVETEILSVSGTGAMNNYTSTSPAPWYNYRQTIRTVILGNGVTKLGSNAFLDCSSLTDIHLPAAIPSISSSSFRNCTGLTNIYISNISDWAAGTGRNLLSCNSNGKNLYLNGNLITDLEIPTGITQIGTRAFAYCSSIRTVTLPDSVTTIGASAFAYCSSIQTVSLPDSVATIGGGAFSCCSGLINIRLPQNLSSIENSTFDGCSSLANIELPDHIETIGERAFFGCKKLSSIVLPGELVNISVEAFYGCTELTSVTVPGKLTTIGVGAFEACQNLRNVHISDLAAWTASDLGYAFSSSHGNEIWLYVNGELVTDLTIPDGVTQIGNWAFANCSQLHSVTVPASVIDIGENAFLAHTGSTGIDQIFFVGGAPDFAADTFNGVTAYAYYPADDTSWNSSVMQDYGGTITWVPCRSVENRIIVAGEELTEQTSVWIDGKEYAVNAENGISYVDLPDSNAKTMVTYTYGESNGKPYPIGMKVWMLSNTDGFYTATRVEELDDALLYAGCSIRIDGVQGIRMITSVDQLDKDALTGNGLAGYTLKEYGTAIAWAGQLGSNRPLVLGKSYVNSNYAYKKDEADPIYDEIDGRIYYTNVVVGFTLKQCSKDLAMRPYMILVDADGNEITLYGGIVERSIHYIATEVMNKYNYAPETREYAYLQNIIEGALT